MSKGILYLIPVPLSETEKYDTILPASVDVVSKLQYFIAEDLKKARQFLKRCNYPAIVSAEISLLNEHAVAGIELELLKPLLAGNDVGLISDAGCPAIADPGAELVGLAHKNDISVYPLVGPSSVLLTAMASGFNGQCFSFVGYLPQEKTARIKKIKELEKETFIKKQAQYFIETPYRNRQLLSDLIQNLKPDTYLCMGIDLTGTGQKILSKKVSDWRKTMLPEVHKIPAVFGIYY